MSAPIPMLLGIAAVLGLPNGFNNMGNQRAMYAVAPAEAMGAASGRYRTSQYVGANLAAAVLVLTFGAAHRRPACTGWVWWSRRSPPFCWSQLWSRRCPLVVGLREPQEAPHP
ncbi:hypothetical protein [Saccharopolyspora mangrovi]|uniref:Uncharacterized protein n=1 Tax=Saccharopolyspora mangrovi TaxID=3082379 RepID=A0ABU6ALA0_9PSEU|nr:hypothetical protein [Saccharopolyspora sp. S2-29]MEB3372090.1 hypothetical protein [Saccharopolyspora sp. S2-29]